MDTKPLVGVTIFTRGNRCYAFIDEDAESDDLSTADWCSVTIPAYAHETSEWYEAAFSGCVSAYRQLQERHQDKDLVLTADEVEMGVMPYFLKRAKEEKGP